jgi:hypothetical protein
VHDKREFCERGGIADETRALDLAVVLRSRRIKSRGWRVALY